MINHINNIVKCQYNEKWNNKWDSKVNNSALQMLSLSILKGKVQLG